MTCYSPSVASALNAFCSCQSAILRAQYSCSPLIGWMALQETQPEFVQSAEGFKNPF